MRILYCFHAIAVLVIVIVVLPACRRNVGVAPTVLVRPTTPPVAPTIVLRANPTVIYPGQSVALQWEAAHATNVRIEPELGTVQGQGARLVNPSSSVTYLATATGPGGTASDSVRITVHVPADRPATARSVPIPPVSLTDLFTENVRPVYFADDERDISRDQISSLNANASWLNRHRDVRFTIQGHCDERGSDEYNAGLGDRRANRVKVFLVKRSVDRSRISVISYGEERLVCGAATEDCYQRNRRAEFVVAPAN